MSYIGSSAAPVPVAFSGVRTQSFSGNGSTSLFTLNRAVSAVTAIEVVVNNVQQSPFDGSYSIVNNGVGLQFSENVSAGTNNIYVTYRDQAIGSLYDTGAVRKAGDVMSGPLSINGAASSASLVIGRGDTSLEGGQLDLCRASDNVAAWGIDVYGAGSTPSLRVIDNAAGAVRLQIDDVGRVAMPNQPAFCGAQTLSVLAGNIVNWNQTRLNRGNNFNASTGKFTAPIAGAYHFSANLISGSTAAASCNIVVNGTVMSSGYTQYDNYNTASATLAIQLAAGDWVAMTTDGAFYGGVYYGAFTGFLIG